MPDIKISISTEAELQAAKSLEQQLERDIAKARLLGQSYDDLAAKLTKVRAGIAGLSQAERDSLPPAVANAEATRKLGDEAGKAATQKSKLLQAIKSATGAFPALNALVSAGLNPWTLIAIAIASAWNWISKWNDEIQQMRDRLKTFEDLNLKVGRFSQLIKQAKVDQEAFDREQKKSKEAGESPEEESSRVSESVARRFGATKQKLEAQKALDLAKVQEAEAGGLPQVEANKQRRAIEARYGKRIADNDLAMKAEQAFVMKASGLAAAGAADQARGQLPGAQSAALEAAKLLQDENSKLKQAKDFAGVGEDGSIIRTKDGGKFTGRLAQLEEEIKQAEASNPFSAPDLKKAAGLKQERDSLLAGITTRQGTVSQLESRSAAASARVSDIQSAITTNDGSARGLLRAAAGISADVRSEFDTQTATGGPRNQTDATLNNAEALAGQNRNATSAVSGRLANTIETTGGIVNSMLSQLQVYDGQMRAFQERIRTLEQRQSRDPQ